MQITGIETFIVSVPYKIPEKWGFGVREGSSPLILKVRTDEGIVGLGETQGPLDSRSIQAIIKNQLEDLAVGEDPFDIERIKRKFLGNGLAWFPEASGCLMAGIEMALWDIVGKKLERPVYQLLGGRVRKKIPFGAYMFLKKPKEMAKDAETYAKEGVKLLKLKVGIDPDDDIARVGAVRKAVGAKIEIVVDANQAWSPGTAVRMIDKLSKYDLLFVEQPVGISDLDGMNWVRRRVRVPIGINEGITNASSVMAAVRREAADIIVTDVTVTGGISECKKVCVVAEAAGLPVIGHSGGELGINLAAMLHVIAATPNFIYPNDTYLGNMSDDILTEPFLFDNGFIEVPHKPGLGVELDERKVAKYCTGRIFSAFSSDSSHEWFPMSTRF